MLLMMGILSKLCGNNIHPYVLTNDVMISIEGVVVIGRFSDFRQFTDGRKDGRRGELIIVQ